MKMRKRMKFACLLDCFDSLRPSQLFFSYVGTGLPGLNQYSTKDKKSCSMPRLKDLLYNPLVCILNLKFIS